MMKLSFGPNEPLIQKAEVQKVVLPAEKELNEQELATVIGGRDGDRDHRRRRDHRRDRDHRRR